jgi:hypothetical protein
MAQLIITFLMFSLSAQAEYRVYKLKISNQQTGKSREILSTLMPREYTLYNTLGAFEKIELVDHWMCWRRSDGFRPLCTRPFASLEKGQKTGSPAPDKPVLSP